MATFGVSMVKDEADVVEGTLRHLAGEVDELIVADNGSTDGTRDILDALAQELPLTVLDDPEPAYYQSAKMTQLAARAAGAGATWIVPFDADEIWYVPADRIRVVLAGLPDDVNVGYAALYNHLCTAVDEPEPVPFQRMVWRQRQAAPMGKVAFRWEDGAVVHQGNHGVSLPSGVNGLPVLTIRHFPYRSKEQFVRKALNGAAAYAATTLPHSQGEHWRSYGRIAEQFGPAALEQVYRDHFWYLSPTDAGLTRDPAPYRRWDAVPDTEPAAVQPPTTSEES